MGVFRESEERQTVSQKTNRRAGPRVPSGKGEMAGSEPTARAGNRRGTKNLPRCKTKQGSRRLAGLVSAGRFPGNSRTARSGSGWGGRRPVFGQAREMTAARCESAALQNPAYGRPLLFTGHPGGHESSGVFRFWRRMSKGSVPKRHASGYFECE